MSAFSPASEVIGWIALRRVQAGAVACVAGVWVEDGRRLPSYLPTVLDELTTSGLVQLADPGPHGPLRRARLNATGQARYEQLLQCYGATHLAQTELEIPAPEVTRNTTD